MPPKLVQHDGSPGLLGKHSLPCMIQGGGSFLLCSNLRVTTGEGWPGWCQLLGSELKVGKKKTVLGQCVEKPYLTSLKVIFNSLVFWYMSPKLFLIF